MDPGKWARYWWHWSECSDETGARKGASFHQLVNTICIRIRSLFSVRTCSSLLLLEWRLPTITLVRPPPRGCSQRQENKRREARGRWERKLRGRWPWLRLYVYVFRLLLLSPHPTPSEGEAVYLICKGNTQRDETPPQQSERCEHMPPVFMQQA